MVRVLVLVLTEIGDHYAVVVHRSSIKSDYIQALHPHLAKYQLIGKISAILLIELSNLMLLKLARDPCLQPLV